MTMINNNIPMTQAQRQKEDIENTSLAPMAAPQGTAFRGSKEDDEDKKGIPTWGKTLIGAAAIYGGALAVRAMMHGSDNGLKAFSGEWWNPLSGWSAKTPTPPDIPTEIGQQLQETIEGAKEATKNPQNLEINTANMKSKALVGDHKKAYEHLLENAGMSSLNDALPDVGETTTMPAGPDSKTQFRFKKTKYGTITMQQVDEAGNKKPRATKIILNEKGEQIARKTYTDANGITQKTTTFENGVTKHNSGYGKFKKGVISPDVKSVIEGVDGKFTTLGQQKAYEALRLDLGGSATGGAAKIDTKGQEQLLYKSLMGTESSKNNLKEQLKTITGMNEAEYKKKMSELLQKHAASGDQISAKAGLAIIDSLTGKTITTTNSLKPGIALVQRFNAAGDIQSLSRYDRAAGTVQEFSNFSESLKKAFKQEDSDKFVQLEDIINVGEDLSINGVKDADHGFIGSVETSYVRPGAKTGQTARWANNAKGNKQLSEKATLALASHSETVEIDAENFNSKDLQKLKSGKSTVTTTYDYEHTADEMAKDDSTLLGDLKLKGAKVVKNVKSNGSNLAVFEMDINQGTAKKMRDIVAERDRHTLYAMAEGNKIASTNHKEAASDLAKLLGTDDIIISGATDIAGGGSLAGTDFTSTEGTAASLNSDYLRNITNQAKTANLATYTGNEFKREMYKGVTSHTIRQFNDEGHLKKLEQYKGEGKESLVEEYKGDGKTLKEKTETTPSGATTKTIYKDGQVSEIIDNDPEGKLVSHAKVTDGVNKIETIATEIPNKKDTAGLQVSGAIPGGDQLTNKDAVKYTSLKTKEEIRKAIQDGDEAEVARMSLPNSSEVTFLTTSKSKEGVYAVRYFDEHKKEEVTKYVKMTNIGGDKVAFSIPTDSVEHAGMLNLFTETKEGGVDRTLEKGGSVTLKTKRTGGDTDLATTFKGSAAKTAEIIKQINEKSRFSFQRCDLDSSDHLTAIHKAAPLDTLIKKGELANYVNSYADYSDSMVYHNLWRLFS